MIPVDDTFGSSTPLEDFVGAIRQAAELLGTSLVPESPPGEESFMFGSPPALLHIQPADFGAYMRAAFRIWVTELRPLLRAGLAEGGCGCGGSPPSDGSGDADCVLLAQINVPLTTDWQVDDLNPVEVDEQRRPFLVPQRFLQDFVAGGGTAPPGGVFIGSPPAFARQTVAAAGMIRGDNFAAGTIFNGLTVTNTAKGEIALTFSGYVQPVPNGPFHYIVKAIPVANVNVKTPNVSFLEFRPAEFALSVANGNVAATQAQIQSMEFMIEVTRFA